MDDRLHSKLRRLGVTKGARKLNTPAPKPKRALMPTHALEKLLPGAHIEETAVGSCLVRDKVYPLSYQYGADRLGELFAYRAETAVPYVRNPQLADASFTTALFLDTETTGLAGAGTLAFMVGVAFFEAVPQADGSQRLVCVVRQYFLRDHADEPAMLHLLEELAADKSMLITFNGRSFDAPLLATRYLLNRMPDPLAQLPHFDLLPPSRRLWRERLGSCALKELEINLLGVQRTHEDVPGWAIPNLYFDYLRTGNPSEMLRVFYHNHEDMLSMVTLVGRIMQMFTAPDPATPPLDLFSLGKWQADLGMVAAAEQTLRQVAQADLPMTHFHLTLQRLGVLLKKNGRRHEAVIIWQQVAATAYDDVSAHEELAKHYEWHERELMQALFWTEQALQLVRSWRNRSYAQLVQQTLTHRLERLQRKIGASPDDNQLS